jgi:uncharacterized protein (TIGR03437 family)
MICQNCVTLPYSTFEPLIVRVSDSGGKPLANVSVTWSISTPTTTVTGLTVTGSDPKATDPCLVLGETCYFFVPPDLAMTTVLSDTVTISAGAATATTYLTQAPPSLSVTPLVGVIVTGPPTGTQYTGQLGTVNTTTPVTVQLVDVNNQPLNIAGVSVRLVPRNDADDLASCSATSPGTAGADLGSVLTNSSGQASCNVLFGTDSLGNFASGDGVFSILIGGVLTSRNTGVAAGYATFSNAIKVSTLPVTIGSIKVISPNNVTAQRGDQLTLTAEVDDTSGKPVPGTTVTWVALAGIGTVSPATSITDVNGRASTSFTVASTASGQIHPAATLTNPPLQAPFTITVITVTSVQPVGGTDNQTGAAGSSFTLTAQIQPVATGVPVTFAVTSGSATLTPANGIVNTNSGGQASVTVTSGSAAGTVKVTATAQSQSYTFTINVTPPGPVVTGITPVTGSDNQSATAGTPFTNPLIVQVTAMNGVANIPVTFSVTSGAATLSPANGAVTTNASGQAQVSVVAGATAGTLQITAQAQSKSYTFNLTVVAAPTVTPSSFLNGAGFYPTSGNSTAALSPCSIGTIVVGNQTVTPPALPNMYPGSVQTPPAVTISIGGVNAPVLNVTGDNKQTLITVQVPCSVIPGATIPAIVTALGATTTVNVTVRSVSPGIYEIPMADGLRRALMVRLNDGSIVSAFPYNPARHGEFVKIYVTGLGQAIPPLDTAHLPVVDATSVAQLLAVGVNGVGTGAVTARPSRDLIGVWEVTFKVPSDAPAGYNVPLTLQVQTIYNSSSEASQFSNLSHIIIDPQ